MPTAALVVLAAESTSSGLNPYFLGAGILLLFVVLMAALLTFGRGRDHS